MASANKILLIILAILLPPVAVFLKKGAGMDLLINIVLWILGVIPGIIHALWVITR
ncbi:MAG: YqaE/Pmp3 family membrane protein [Gammaproteobacteria bacterium]|nr:YqaE/Pmp3 family membrane protein [Gammaproteobacteria bacterium]